MDLDGEIIQDIRMRILLLHDPYLPIRSGAVGGEDNLAQLEHEILSKLGHEVIDGRVLDTGMIKKFNQLRAQTVGSTPEVLELINFSKPDVVHTHNLNQRSGYAWMGKHNTPIVSSIHNYRLFCPASIAYRDGQHCVECRDRGAVRAIKNNCDGIRGSLNASRQILFQRSEPQIVLPKIFLVASKSMEHQLKIGIPSNKFRILRNPGSLTEPAKLSQAKRKGWIFAGRLVEEKGILDLINNWPLEENLDIAGSGPLFSEISELISNKSNIRLIGTYTPGENQIYSSYEGLIFPSKWFEGSPLVIVDCLGTGTPVIGSNLSGASEQIELSKAGYVINGELSTSKLRMAQRNIRENFSIYSRNAIEAISGEFSTENWGRKLEGYLQEAIELP
jgi:glycosyltransferase involved in cell wall biosynthesis